MTHTADNAANSLLLRTFHRKVKVIPPPVEVASVLPNEVREFTKRWSLGDRQVIGMASRFAAEKGVEILLGALPIVLEAFPDAVVLFAGEHLDVVGESGYQHKLAPMLRVHPRWIDVGYLTEEELACFYASCSLTVLPSLNTTEAFGMVQVEGMLCGAPAVVSDLPGVRVPVQQTGMGLIVPVGDERALARAIIRVLEDRESFVRPRAVIEAQFSTEATVTAYERLYCAQVLKSSGEPRGRRVCRRR